MSFKQDFGDSTGAGSSQRQDSPPPGTPPYPPDILTFLSQQQSVLTSIAQTLANQSAANSSQQAMLTPPPPAIKNLPLPKLAAPDNLSIPQFRDWKQRWNDYVAAHQLTLHPITSQQGVLRSALDTEWTMLWSTDRIKINQTNTLEEIVNLLEIYLRRRRNPLLDRQQFLKRDQMEGESIDRYYAALKTLDTASAHEDNFLCSACNVHLSTNCGSCTRSFNLPSFLQDLRIRDRLICGLRDKEMQKKVLAEQYTNALTLEKVLSLCIAIENSTSVGDSLVHSSSSQEAFAAAKSSYKKMQLSQEPAQQQTPSQPKSQQCWFCDQKRHPRSKCPAKDTICSSCGSKGHYAKVCRSGQKQQQRGGNSKPEDPPNEDHSPNLTKSATHISMCNAAVNIRLRIPTTFNGKSHLVNWLPDTGADVNAISLRDVERFKAESCITPEKVEVYAANGASLGPVGTINATLKLNQRTYSCKLRVYRSVTTPLLSKEGCVALGLIDKNWPTSSIHPNQSSEVQEISSSHPTMVQPRTAFNPNLAQLKAELISDVPEVFNDVVLRPMEGPPMKIELIDGAIPCKRYKAHTVPYHWRDSVKAQLDSMVQKGVIEPVPVGEAVEWCHPMVVVPKKGSSEPRITVDLTGLNPFVKRPAYPVKVPREVIARIPPGNKYFTTLDARHGYWQVPLDESSKKLTTFVTPWGCFRYCRNVMGLISAGDEHNRRGDEAIQGISNVEKIVEDILIYDKDLETHVLRVRETLGRCDQHGITLNSKKFQFAMPSVDWCGYRISKHGYSPAPHLTQALTNFPVPVSKTDVRSFCGLIQQFESFSHRITELAAPLRSLLSAKSTFIWESFHQLAFEQLIKELSSPRVLTHFQPGCHLRLETDAAQSRGLGFALWQQSSDGNWKLLQVGSRYVTPTESRYSASEIELLAVVWAIRKCRLFLLGQTFQLVVDHRPLIPIINAKTLDEIDNPRLQRLKEKLSSYRPQAIWRAGTKHTIVDVFSRYPSSDPEPEDLSDDMDADVTLPLAAALHDHEDGSPILEDKILTSVAEATALSSECQRLQHHIRHGFPAEKCKLDEDLRPYWQFKDSLTVDEGVILCGSRLLIPKILRPSILQTLHASHQGEIRTLRRARQAVFWPALTNDVKNVIRTCQECCTRLPSHQKEPLYSDPPPTRPFQCVGVDLFSFAGNEYLVMTDRYSGWINVAKCGVTASTDRVIQHLKRWMTDLGIPQKLESDNGPQFNSMQFKDWTSSWGILHSTSSPHYPQSNGLSEAGVKTAKNLLAKSAPSGNLDSESFQLGLLELRNTPRADGYSPAQLVFGSSIRSKLPLHRSQFAHKWKTQSSEVDQHSTTLQEKMRQYYNANSKPLPQLELGAIVRIQNHRTGQWDLLGQIVDIHPRGRSYTIRTESGRVLRRNRRFLRRAHTQSLEESNEPPPQPNPPPRRSTRNRRRPLRYANSVRFDQGSNLEGGHVRPSIMVPHASSYRVTPTKTKEQVNGQSGTQAWKE